MPTNTNTNPNSRTRKPAVKKAQPQEVDLFASFKSTGDGRGAKRDVNLSAFLNAHYSADHCAIAIPLDKLERDTSKTAATFNVKGQTNDKGDPQVLTVARVKSWAKANGLAEEAKFQQGMAGTIPVLMVTLKRA